MKMNFQKIERKWQKRWEKAKIFEANVDKKRKKFFITFPYPYVNGEPHIGAAFTAFRCDSYAKFKRMQGFNVLYPQGFHATGEPILGAIERLKQGDPVQINTFKAYGATDKDIKNFIKYGPEYTARYWMKRWIEVLKLAGFGIDWRRTFITAITPTYCRFIEWQYNTLRKKGYVIQGTHPVIWCPHCQSPTGDHDRLVGEGESPIEYIIIKFRLDSGEVIPCGTLRPETVYGVTNIWINPDAEYIWSDVNGEVWLLTEAAIEKLRDQLKEVRIIGKIKGSKLVGKYCENPVLKNKIPILPAGFVDPNSATGIVMSVPSHAPYDWIGLHELKRNPEELKKYGVDPDIVKGIKPISIISTEGLGEHPAIDICNKMNIRSQNEKDKLEKATNLVYKKEFHLGKLKEGCGDHAGLKVSEIKEKLSEEFIKDGVADSMWEVTGKVVCRCGTLCHVKILKNQWFLKYSDEKWKEKVRNCIKGMKFYPEEARLQFLNTVDWLKDKACTRKTGLGTRLPWDKEWIIETLSDSVIYMAYYTIARVINEKKIPAEKLTDEVFDYVFLGKGNLNKISKRCEIRKDLLKEMRKEFEYFYPVDLRNSAKELVQNHLTFYLFHHVAIWNNPRYWPRAIGVNGFVQISGEKMSKSKGNIYSLRELVKNHGADVVRINIISSNEGMEDAEWKEENIKSFITRIEFLSNLIKNWKKSKRHSLKNIDRFLQSKVQQYIQSATQNYEEMKFRSVTQNIFFNFMNDVEWYLDRCGGIKNCNKKVLFDSLSTAVKLLYPLLPHVMEEFGEKLGFRKFVAISEWPKVKKSLIERDSELGEEMIKQTLEDIKNIQKILKTKPKQVHIIIAPNWKFNVYKKVLKNKDKTFREIVNLVKKNEIEYAKLLFKKIKQLPDEFLGRKNQLKVFNEAKKFLKEKLKCKIIVEEAEKSKLEKAKNADVIKPAIYLC